MTPARLLSVATATPPHVIDQAVAAQLTAEHFKGQVFRTSDLLALFENTGIKTRRAVRPMPWYAEPRDWTGRNDVYLDAAEALYIEAAERALLGAGLSAAEVGTVVTVSSTGIATPSLEARVHGRLGFRPDVRRVPVFGLGCQGGVAGLSLAARLARADPGKPVLLVIVELCTLSARPDEATKANIVATALFGDGAAAAVVNAGLEHGEGREIEAEGERLWPDTLHIMGWRMDPVGFGVVLASDLPVFATENLPAAVEGFLLEAPFGRAEVARFVCHPGGAKVLPALEAAIGVDEGELDVEREVLAEFGNMSAPTVFFVLERVLRRGEAGRLVMTALGPGFTVGFVALGPAHA
jgi:alkylresorcinol/alkylpyrone synthase